MVKNKNNRLILSEKNNLILKEIASNIVFVVIFGALVNFMLWSIWGLPFTFFTFIGYGILSFIIEVEIPEIINKIK